MIKGVEDIHKEASLEKKNKMKDNIVKDVGDILKGVMQESDKVMESEKRRKIAKVNAIKIKSPWIHRFKKLTKVILGSLLLLMIINWLLFNVWIFKYFIGSIF